MQYGYDSTNKRIWKGTISGGAMTAQEVYFYGLNNQRLATYAIIANAGSTPYLANSATNLAVFFRRKRVGITTNGTTTAFVQNRLGSQGNGYYPYGEDRGTPLPNDQVKFATYTRDSATGLDYADQRYYANNFGRFMTPDPSATSSSPKSPTSWNLYSYVGGDPINVFDPMGLCGENSGQTGAPSDVECGNGNPPTTFDGVAGPSDAPAGYDGATNEYFDPTTGTWNNPDNGTVDPETGDVTFVSSPTENKTAVDTNSSDTGDLNTAVTASYSFFTPPYMLGGQINTAVIPTGQKGGKTYCLGGAIGVCGFSTKPITRSPLKPITHSPGKPISVLL